MNETPILFQHLSPSRRHLRLAVVTETYPPEINGVAMTLGRLVSAMLARGHQIQLIRPRQNQAELPVSTQQLEEVLQLGVSIPRYDGLKMGLPAKRALLQRWTKNRPDLVHIATEGPLGWSALAAALKLRIPVATDFHTNFHSYSKHYGIGWLKKPIVAYLRKFHNKAHCTMVPTDSLRTELSACGYKNLLVVQRGVDTQLFNPGRRSEELRRQWGAQPADPVAIYVGRLAPEKNLALIAASFHAMKQHNPAVKLVMVGDGPERAVLQKQHPDIIFAGARRGEDLAAHYASGDVFLFPSLTETYGNVTMEAMASGLAVVAFNYAAAAQHVRHGHSGMLADFADSDMFIRLAAELASAAGLTAHLRASAVDSAAALDWEHIYQQFETILLQLASMEDCNDPQTGLSFESN